MSSSYAKNTTEPDRNGTFSPTATSSENIAIISVYCFIMLVSSVGNALVLAVVYRNKNKRMRTAINYFIVNMSCSDLLITFCNIPLVTTSYVTNKMVPFSGVMGNIFCKLTTLLFYLSIEVSLMSLVAITVDRFLAVFYPLKRIITNKTARIVISVMWFAAIIFDTPLVMYSTLYENDYFRLCIFHFDFTWGSFQAYLIACLFTFVVLPLLIMLVLYSSIVIKLFRQKPPGENSAINQEHHNKRNRRVLFMLVVVVTLTMACWLPFWSTYVDCVMTFSMLPCTTSHYLRILAFANCALNPCVYAIFYEHFRSSFCGIFRTVFRRSSCKCICFRRNRIENDSSLETRQASQN